MRAGAHAWLLCWTHVHASTLLVSPSTRRPAFVPRYLALLNSALSVHLPLLPAYWDNWPNAVADFWKGLNDDAWREFSSPRNFGVGHQKVVRRNHGRFVRDRRCPHAQLPKGHHDMVPAKRWPVWRG